jgi:hypothetical protein
MKDTEEFSKEGLPLPKIFTAEGSSCLAEQCNVFNSRELNLGDFETLKGDSSQAIAHGKRKLKKKKQGGIPRWRLEVGSRKRSSYSEILERLWRHTLQA